MANGKTSPFSGGGNVSDSILAIKTSKIRDAVALESKWQHGGHPDSPAHPSHDDDGPTVVTSTLHVIYEN